MTPPGAYRFFLKRGEEAEREVSRQEWIAAERAAGFVPKGGTDGPATAGFGARGVEGRIEGFDPEDPI